MQYGVPDEKGKNILIINIYRKIMKHGSAYPAAGMAISLLLFTVGAAADMEVCLMAGTVFFLCNAGVMAGMYFREKK